MNRLITCSVSLFLITLALPGCGDDPLEAVADVTASPDVAEPVADAAEPDVEGPDDTVQPTDTATEPDAGDPDQPDIPDIAKPDVPPAPTFPQDEVLRLQHVQLRGTHNSYHQKPDFVVHGSHDYTQPPLDVQAGQLGVRAFELDVHKQGDEWQIYHIWLLDQASSCATLIECLTVLSDWSQANPWHLPLVVWIEAKQVSGGESIDAPETIDDAIFAAVPPEVLFTPDDLRGEHATIADALASDGWPTLSVVRGRLMVVLLSTDKSEAYRDGAPNLEGRAMFMRAEANELDEGWAAVAKHLSGNDLELAQLKHILVADNVCGADEDAADCEGELQEKLDAGYHMLKDDFPGAVEGEEYFFQLPGDVVARCNPKTAPVSCVDGDLEGVLP
ncbi:MAG: hypothetical protein ACI9WU_000504 [Myxococcota bacterium]